MAFVFHPICISKKKLKNCRAGQPHRRLEGSQFYEFNQQTFTRQFFVGKIHGNSTKIHKVMTLCVNWHS